MEVLLLIASLSIAMLVMVNFLATVYVGHAAGYSRQTKLWQIIAIWLLPFIGALLFTYRLWRERVRYQLVRESRSNRRFASNFILPSSLPRRPFV